MAAVAGPNLPLHFMVVQQMIACEVEHGPAVFGGLTKAEHIAAQIFQNRYDVAMYLTVDDFSSQLKQFSNLTMAMGQIKLPPGTISNIKGFIQYCRNKIRLGRDPARAQYKNCLETYSYIDRMKRHDEFVKKSKSIKKPKEFSPDLVWEEWVITFRRYLKQLPGQDGVPLSYIICDNEDPDPTLTLIFYKNTQICCPCMALPTLPTMMKKCSPF